MEPINSWWTDYEISVVTPKQGWLVGWTSIPALSGTHACMLMQDIVLPNIPHCFYLHEFQKR